MPTQCLESWFSCQEISRIFDISCQDLGNYSWQGSQDFCEIFQDRGKKSKKFFGFIGKKIENIQDLGKRTKKNLGFLAKRNLGFFRFLAKILAINLGKSCKSLQDFSRFWKGIHKIFLEFFARKSRIIKILARESCNQVLHQSTTRSIDILSAIILKNSKKGLLLLRVLLFETQLSLTKKN